jgi:lysophospholipase L1-like esterase
VAAAWEAACWLSSGVGTLLLLAAAAAFSLLCARESFSLAHRLATGRERRPQLFARLVLTVAAVATVLVLFELFLQRDAARRPLRAVSAGPAPLTMPEGLARRDAWEGGRRIGYWWQGELHRQDARGMRRSDPFPGRRPGVFRVLAYGDSLTYGVGVGEAETWPRRLEAGLGGEYSVEVLNLGVPGMQSESILGIMREFTPRLEPDLVLYGVCLNDFLPRGRGERVGLWTLPIPLADPGRSLLATQTLTGRFVWERGERALIRLHLRNDFLDDILENFDEEQERFSLDARAMNDDALGRGLPPVLARVLYQEPSVGSRSARVTAIAERDLAEAGMTVIATEAFTREHDGERMEVSPWEGHPSARAQQLFADDFAAAIARIPAIRPFRRGLPAPSVRTP